MKMLPAGTNFTFSVNATGKRIRKRFEALPMCGSAGQMGNVERVAME